MFHIFIGASYTGRVRTNKEVSDISVLKVVLRRRRSGDCSNIHVRLDEQTEDLCVCCTKGFVNKALTSELQTQTVVLQTQIIVAILPADFFWVGGGGGKNLVFLGVRSLTVRENIIHYM